jgi:hypothetical protein
VLLVLLLPALACDNDVTRRVVGWSAAGEVLVRVEHLDDDGELHALSLELVGARASETWSILTPEDHGDASIRGKRWREAEAVLQARGVQVDLSLQPIAGSPEDWAKEATLSDGTVVSVDGYSYDGSYARRTLLKARRADRSVDVRVLSEAVNTGGGYQLQQVYEHRESATVVLQGAVSPPWTVVVPMALVDAAFLREPGCPSQTTHRVVGWSEAGGALVRSEATAADGQTCLLSLRLVGTSADQRLDILRPEDRGDAALRARRWTEAEAVIRTAGVVLDPGLEPAHGKVGARGNMLNQPLSVLDREDSFVVRNEPRGTDATALVLYAEQRKGRSVPVRDLLQLPFSDFPYGVDTLWAHPGGVSVVWLPSYGSDQPLHTLVRDVDEAWAR